MYLGRTDDYCELHSLRRIAKRKRLIRALGEARAASETGVAIDRRGTVDRDGLRKTGFKAEAATRATLRRNYRNRFCAACYGYAPG